MSWAYRQGNDWEVRGWVWLQNDKITDKVWTLFRNQESWQEMIMPGSLETRPIGEWSARTTDDIANLLEETR